jgi:hypothetical protein
MVGAVIDDLLFVLHDFNGNRDHLVPTRLSLSTSAARCASRARNLYRQLVELLYLVNVVDDELRPLHKLVKDSTEGIIHVN